MCYAFINRGNNQENIRKYVSLDGALYDLL